LQSSSFLTISDLWIERGERDLCKGLCFDVQIGEIVRILGENGAGKSSLLKVIAGLMAPLEGRIFYSGKDITSNQNTLQQNTIYIGHSTGVKSVLTVEENIRLYCPNISSKKLHSVLSDLGLLSHIGSLVKTLSAGQIRRVALSRLWLSDKTLWLLDEPFAALDAQGVQALEMHIQQYVTSGGTVILTTHQALNAIHSRDIELL
jgi:heme exporter protein A